jgi:hypothetical protein
MLGAALLARLAAVLATAFLTGAFLSRALRGLPAAMPVLRFFSGAFFGRRRMRRGRVLNAMIPPVLADPSMAWRSAQSHAEARLRPEQVVGNVYKPFGGSGFDIRHPPGRERCKRMSNPRLHQKRIFSSGP